MTALPARGGPSLFWGMPGGVLAEIELRPRGAPPPAPPRSFLTERGEFDRAPAGRGAWGTPPPVRHHRPTSPKKPWGRLGGRIIDERRASCCIRTGLLPPPRPFAFVPHGEGKIRSRSGRRALTSSRARASIHRGGVTSEPVEARHLSPALFAGERPGEGATVGRSSIPRGPPVHPFTRSPVHPFTRSPLHPFTKLRPTFPRRRLSPCGR
jgi:hypothetical protein